MVLSAKMLSTRLRALICLFALAFVCSATAYAQFTFDSFSVPGSNSTSPTAINNNGDVAGSYTDNFGTHGFIRTHTGVFTTFDEPGAQGTFVTGINDSDEVSGDGYVPGVFPSGIGSVGYTRSASGAFTLFYGPLGTGAQVIGLTNLGESIVSVNNFGTVSYYLRSAANVYTALLCPTQFPNCTFTALNNSGQAAGTLLGSGEVLYGFSLELSSGALTDFSYSPAGNNQGGQQTYATSISDSGAVAGYYNALYQGLGYVRSPDGSTLDSFLIPFDDAASSTIVGVNQSGEIAGLIVAPGYGSNGMLGIPATDRTPPSVSVLSIVTGPPAKAIFSVVDANSGVFNVEVNEVNGAALITPLTPGQKTPVRVSITKLDQSMTTTVQIQASDMDGNYVVFDPQMVTVSGTGSVAPAPLTDIPRTERVLTIANGSPGLQTLHIAVNGVTTNVALQDGQKKTISLKSQLTKLTGNTIAFSGDGPETAAALLVLTQASN